MDSLLLLRPVEITNNDEGSSRCKAHTFRDLLLTPLAALLVYVETKDRCFEHVLLDLRDERIGEEPGRQPADQDEGKVDSIQDHPKREDGYSGGRQTDFVLRGHY